QTPGGGGSAPRQEHNMRASAAVLCLVVAAPAGAAPKALDLEGYLIFVARNNMPLAAQRMNIDIAEAQVDVAGAFPEPQLTAGPASLDVTQKGSPTAIEAGVSETFELGGKRGGRVAVADHAVVGARRDFDDFLRTLKGSAANAFVDALAARLVLDRKERTLE